MPAIGTVVGGQYQILSILGKGGEACVYLVQDLRLRKKWAIKEIAHHPKTRVQERRSQRLINEAAVLRELSHPNMPRVVDIFSQDDVTYIVMDYIEGVSLEEYVKEAGMVTEEQVIRWGISIAKTLLYLHAQQPPVIYRDLKPSNLILTEAGELMLVDFGIAGAQSIACGTRAFAAPEQIREGTSGVQILLLCTGPVRSVPSRKAGFLCQKKEGRETGQLKDRGGGSDDGAFGRYSRNPSCAAAHKAGICGLS